MCCVGWSQPVSAQASSPPSVGRLEKGFVIYGPDGKPLRSWDTENGDHDVDDEGK
jgi:hypothetical protein